ncbi:hypothetical protein CICLE_v10027014mg, partial [Citrus x clementina]
MDAMDRISELPTPIIHHMMSYLDAKELARTSILSKRWNGLSIAFPVLDFALPYSFHMNLYYDWYLRRRRRILEIDEWETYEWEIDEYEWETYEWETDKSVRIKEFIKFVDASLLQFHELKLCIQKLRLPIIRNEDEGMFSHVDKWIELAVRNGVKEREIGVMPGENAYSLPETIYSAKLLTSLEHLNSLKKLTLYEVYINEQMVQKLISECLSLEDLCFYCCSGLKILSVSQARNLKNMTIVSEWPSEHYEVQEFISNFPLLEDLSINWCRSLKRFKIISNRLKHLIFRYCWNLKAIEVDTPNLLSFIYKCNPIPIISMNAPCPWKVRCRRVILDKRCYSRLKQFLGASNRIESLTITLMERIGSKLRKWSYLCIIFLICYPKTLRVHIETGNTDLEFVE